MRYPGWDTEALFFPAEISATARLTLAVAPEGACDIVLRAIASAQSSLRIEAYTIESVALYQAITERVQAGVVVTVLVESGPAGGGMDETAMWIAQRLNNPPTSTVYFIGRAASRYRYQHAKFILVDDRLALVSSDNFGENSMPADPKDNGTLGHRGFVALTDSAAVFARLEVLFRRDCDPLHHADVTPWDGSFAPPGDFSPLPPVDWTAYAAPFTTPLATTATHVSVLHAPEHALRDTDGLLGMLGRVGPGGRIDVLQMNEPFTWTEGIGQTGLNPRLAAVVEAARRGARVRVLLDGYYDDPLEGNGNTAACRALDIIADREALDLACRLVNVTGLGVHAKVFLVHVDGEGWVHLGSLNGTESASKRNREVALQFQSWEAYEWMETVFEHDWKFGRGPLMYHFYLPVVMRDHVAAAGHPLFTELSINPEGQDAGREWIELYNPGPDALIAGWRLGDAIEVGDYRDGRYAFPPGSHLLHGQVIVIAGCASDFSARYGRNPDYEWAGCSVGVVDLEPVGAWEGFGLALGNEGDEVLLTTAGGERVDSVAWGGDSRVGVTPFVDYDAPFPPGSCLKRYPPDVDRDDCGRDFYVSYYPSPGQ